MRAAQTLYEGVDIAGHGTVGLITYMRTDSLRIAAEAQAAAKTFIAERWGENYVCKTARKWKTAPPPRAGRPRGHPPLDARADPRRGRAEHQRRAPPSSTA